MTTKRYKSLKKKGKKKTMNMLVMELLSFLFPMPQSYSSIQIENY